MKDTTPPAGPKIKSMGNNSRVVQGKAEAGSKITVRKGNVQLASGNANSEGSFKITMKSAQKAGTARFIQATDKTGNKSPAIKTIVKDKTAPALININKFTPKSTKVKGTTEPNATVIIKVNSKVEKVKQINQVASPFLSRSKS
ncbi:Ig-like domain-containing protein [Bacillus sp. D386]|uniref:Ig-like domain-containing protein n=1 Tax=Bacillus sp. D386 TaxID=2587155 RepID=UPI0035A37CE3